MIVHTPEHCISLFETARELDIAPIVQNAPGSVVVLGFPYIIAMLNGAQKQVPIEYQFYCDCGDNPAFVVEAMGYGFKQIFVHGLSDEMLQKLQAMASQYDAVIKISDFSSRYFDMETNSNHELEQYLTSNST